MVYTTLHSLWASLRHLRIVSRRRRLSASSSSTIPIGGETYPVQKCIYSDYCSAASSSPLTPSRALHSRAVTRHSINACLVPFRRITLLKHVGQNEGRRKISYARSILLLFAKHICAICPGVMLIIKNCDDTLVFEPLRYEFYLVSYSIDY